MPDTVLKIISTSPIFVPDKSLKNECRLFLEKLFDRGSIELFYFEQVEFIDQGENFERINCDICSQEIDIEYWQKAMDDSYLQQFRNLNFITPCCESVTSLNSLQYNRVAGFAKFCAQITNPKVDLSFDNLQKLQAILKTPLKVIIARY